MKIFPSVHEKTIFLVIVAFFIGFGIGVIPALLKVGFSAKDIPIIVSLCAILFTIFTFWWLNARQGKVLLIGPQYVFGQYKSEKLAVQLPVVLQNTGPRAIVISAFTLRFADRHIHNLVWIGFSTDPLNGSFSFKKPIALKGFDAKEAILYFQRENTENLFESKDVEIQAIWSGNSDWKTVASFTLPGSSDGWDEKFKGIDIVGGVDSFRGDNR